MGTVILTRLAAPFGMWETHAPDPLDHTPDEMVDLRDQWRECRDGQAIPRALDFTPLALRRLAGNLAVVDLRLGVDQARYLWAGPNLVQLFGGPLTGRLLSQCYSGQILQEVRDAYRRMLTMSGPVFSDRRFRVFSEKLGYHRLLLPLLDDRGEIGFAMLMLLPRGGLRSAVEWRGLEMELDLANALRSGD
ncbi:MAG: PAS domain-containing protein [Niveispirillum sp.]|uniref:PAS domain-containing protein n=1 Tax=Niveispirillum sp. TaxID=1917217 RepID=UPI003BA65E1B